ncbi:MAG TPA: fumarate hydratase [Candidatus Tripitaka californicus]|uniref:fumarate hydratase n=1 Tax=Candidatus Tripitaka californicus TaxID=3367616 RepID=UPI004026080A
MRRIEADTITQVVERLCMEANYFLGQDVIDALERSLKREESPIGQQILRDILENARIGGEELSPICQDTGFTVAFVELGQEVEVTGGRLDEAITKGVAQGYTKGFLRASIVQDPLRRINTKDNTPPVIHVEVVPGDRLRLTVMCKGSGCENMSRFAMLTPAQGRKGVVNFVVETALKGGGRPCPPLIVGVGLGGTFDQATYIAKKSLLRPVGSHHTEAHIKELEEELLEKVNATGVGPQGWGGRTTALAVHVETYPCHIASLPVAVNIECHSHRLKTTIL